MTLWIHRTALRALQALPNDHGDETVTLFASPEGLDYESEMVEIWIEAGAHVPQLSWRSGLREPPERVWLDCNYGWEPDFPLAQKAVITLTEEDALDRGGAPVWQEYVRVRRPE